MTSGSSLAERANRLADAGHLQDAIGMLEHGDADDLFELGVWFDSGRWVAQDRAHARDLFGRAADAGSPQADTILTNFLGNGTGGSRDWAAAVDRLRQRSATDERAAFELDLIEQMDLDENGNPTEIAMDQLLSASPNIRLVPGLLTKGECAYLAVAAGPYLQPATVVDNLSGKAIRNPIRTSETAVMTPPLESLVIQAINRRLAAATETNVYQGEPLQVLGYQPGQEYKPHIDAIPSLDNQRVWTALVYLNDGYEGGETQFVSGAFVRGQTGTALIFRNVDEEGRPDKRTAHRGCPVTKGTKLLASRWIRERPFAPDPNQHANA